MTEGNGNGAQRLVKDAADQAAQAYQVNMQMGKAWMDAWTQAMTAGANAQSQAAQNPWMAMMTPWGAPPAPQQPEPTKENAGGFPGNPPFANVTRVWLDAIAKAAERVNKAAASGETLTPDAFMDIWSKASADLAQAVVSDTAFASLTGQWVNTVSQAKTEAKKAANRQLREMGFATHEDVDEVGRRLVELERRMHEMMLALEEREDKSSRRGSSKSQKK